MSKSGGANDVFDLVNDLIKIDIWFEIMQDDGITTKEISKRLNLIGKCIYYHLNHLKENKFISTNLSTKP
jgi:predicted transcriptional regulator